MFELLVIGIGDVVEMVGFSKEDFGFGFTAGDI